MSVTDTVTYFCTWMGIARAGYTVFHISPRNSSAALAHLLRHRNVVHVLTSPEPGIKAIVTASLTSIGMKEDQRSTFVSEMPDFEFLFKAEPDAEPLPKGTFDSDGIICYIHSSGVFVDAELD
jgi:acyl-CoA synthetase (AMP-forming)/AMP-acid ligase II